MPRSNDDGSHPTMASRRDGDVSITHDKLTAFVSMTQTMHVKDEYAQAMTDAADRQYSVPARHETARHYGTLALALVVVAALVGFGVYGDSGVLDKLAWPLAFIVAAIVGGDTVKKFLKSGAGTTTPPSPP